MACHAKEAVTKEKPASSMTASAAGYKPDLAGSSPYKAAGFAPVPIRVYAFRTS